MYALKYDKNLSLLKCNDLFSVQPLEDGDLLLQFLIVSDSFF